MKTDLIKYFLFSALVLGTSVLRAQSKADRIFDTFRNKPGVTYLAFTKDLKDAFHINLEDEGKEIKGDLHEIRLLSYNPAKGKLSSSGFMKKAVDMLPGAYRCLKTDGEDSDAAIWMLGNKKKVSEFHVFVGNENQEGLCFLVSFYGDFFLDDADGIKKLGVGLSLDL